MSDPTKTSAPQEIDLLELFSRMGQSIKKALLGILRSILFLIVFGIKNFHFIALFGIGGALIGQLLFNTSQRYYSSYLVAQTNGMSSADMINYLNDLYELSKNGNSKALAKSLEMHDTSAAKIKSIQAFYLVDLDNDGIGDYVDLSAPFSHQRDTSLKRIENRIHLTVEVFNNDAFEEVKQGLYSYMSKNPYLIKLTEIRRKQLKEQITQINYEITQLDSLQRTDYLQKTTKLPVNQSQMMFLTEQQQQLFHNDKLQLLRRKQGLEKELEFSSEAFTVIKDFTALSEAENTRGKYIIKYGFFLSVFGYFLLLGIKYRVDIKRITAF